MNYQRIEVIGIDHGWSKIKTVNGVFTTGVKKITTRPALPNNIVYWGGQAYERCSTFCGFISTITRSWPSALKRSARLTPTFPQPTMMIFICFVYRSFQLIRRYSTRALYARAL